MLYRQSIDRQSRNHAPSLPADLPGWVLFHNVAVPETPFHHRLSQLVGGKAPVGVNMDADVVALTTVSPIKGRGVDLGINRPLPAIVVIKALNDVVYSGIFPICKPPLLGKLIRPKIFSLDGSLLRLLVSQSVVAGGDQEAHHLSLWRDGVLPFVGQLDKSM
ncbi:MAG: hypothetical protein GY740_00070 [Gammaproteobacteria bacterium]|nr:hypothetical protein [Gammaproteobacteria bacterium]